MNKNTPKTVSLKREGHCLVVVVGGTWNFKDGLYKWEALDDIQNIIFVEENLENWDSSLISFLVECRTYCELKEIECSFDKMSLGVQKLLKMSQDAIKVEHGNSQKQSIIQRLGKKSLSIYEDGEKILNFLGLCILSFFRVFSGKGQMRLQDFWFIVQNVSSAALLIVSLISFLTGFIMAFVGAVQLEKFGATIYIADLVGLAMVREMGAIMASVIMCGRTGAAFAATIGTMKVNEELDALTTSGISVVDFVIAPRILALVCMMPLLCVFSDFVGILGGFFVGIGVMNISFIEYFNQTKAAVGLTDFWIGVVKGGVFGGIVAFTGSLRGIQCGSDSGSVGIAATSAVVTGITFIIIADAIFAVILNILNI